jgi:hypothetical protein
MTRRDQVIKSVKSRMVKKTVKEALEIDWQGKMRLWHDAIVHEMTAIRIALDIKEKGLKAPVGYQYADCQMIFDVKMDLTRKARFVAGAHMTEPPVINLCHLLLQVWYEEKA